MSMLGNPALLQMHTKSGLLSRHPTLRPALYLGNPHSSSLEALASSVNANCPSLFPAARLFVQLVDLFQFYMMFPIDDHTGDPVSDEDVTAAHYEKVQQVVHPHCHVCKVHLSMLLKSLYIHHHVT